MKLKWNKRKKREGEKKKKNGIIQYLRYPERKIEALLPFVFSFPFSRYTLYLFSRLADATWIKITRRNKMANEVIMAG